MDITGCRNVMVSNCDIIGGDDALCLKSENPYGSEVLPTKNITITNCVVASASNGFKNGHEPLVAPSKTSLSPTAPSTPTTTAP